MVNLAEQGYFKQSQQFDPAWQEMLNHSTMKVLFDSLLRPQGAAKTYHHNFLFKNNYFYATQ